MAIKDIESIQVAPGEEDKVTRLWMSFGWELKNKQRVKTQDVQKYAGQSSDRTTTYYETTKGVDFFELTFERNPERKNYTELKSLEKQYYAVNFPSPPSSNSPKRFGLGFSLLILISLFFGILCIYAAFSMFGSRSSTNVIGGIIGLLIGAAILTPGILIIITRIKSYPKRLKPWEEAWATYKKESSEAEKKRSELLERAQSLV